MSRQCNRTILSPFAGNRQIELALSAHHHRSDSFAILLHSVIIESIPQASSTVVLGTSTRRRLFFCLKIKNFHIKSDITISLQWFAFVPNFVLNFVLNFFLDFLNFQCSTLRLLENDLTSLGPEHCGQSCHMAVYVHIVQWLDSSRRTLNVRKSHTSASSL